MDNDYQIIGLDQGWQNIKTESTVFTSAVEERSNPTFFDDILEYEGKYYCIGGKRLEIKNNKVEDDDYYLLMLAALAKELEARGGITEATVYLAVGLPLTRFGEERTDYVAYLSRNKELHFKFNKKTYHINLLKVFVYPQCYSAVFTRIPEFKRKTVVVDVGSWTVDILPVISGKPYDAGCNSLPHGVITCLRQINKECYNGFNYELDEDDIDFYIKNHELDTVPVEVLEMLDRMLQEYADDVIRKLKEHSINVETTSIIFVGGGANIIKAYSTMVRQNMEFLLDVKANAKGYAFMARAAVRMERR